MRIVDDMLTVMALSSRILEFNNAELYRVCPYASAIILFLFMMKLTWCIILVDFLSQIKYSPKSIQGVVIWMVFCTKGRNPDNPRNVSYFNWNDNRWYQNWNNLDNQWNDNDLVLRR